MPCAIRGVDLPALITLVELVVAGPVEADRGRASIVGEEATVLAELA